MHTTFGCAKRIYRLAETRGHAFSANTYLSLRSDGWNAEGALNWARRAYCGQSQAYRPRDLRHETA